MYLNHVILRLRFRLFYTGDIEAAPLSFYIAHKMHGSNNSLPVFECNLTTFCANELDKVYNNNNKKQKTNYLAMNVVYPSV